jgi:tRNA A-37 threonylcarbamoyl transferase component Bud32
VPAEQAKERFPSKSELMSRWAIYLILWTSLVLTEALADTLPIRVDTGRNASVYVRNVDQGADFELISDRTPATYPAIPGERVDIKAVAADGFFFRWEGSRQNVAGPANITIRMERSLAWEKLALLGGGVTLILAGLLFVFRRRVVEETESAKTQIIQLEERIATAERVGALARTLGDYTVLSKLGSGAMGVVYKVENEAGDIYAAKVPNELDDRVLREAEVSASLKAPNIVECYGLIEGETTFLLLEYMDGVTLHEWLADNVRLPLIKIDRLIMQLLDAVEVAHSQGVYHRDLKPENMFLTNVQGEEVLKVMDFGLASSVNAARLTRTGEAMGTPIYASPEQLSGNPVDATTDLYSVGVLIFELATGILPWKKVDPVALTLQKYKPLPKEPIAIRKDMPMAWNQLVVDLLNGDPLKRPRDVADVKRRWNDGKASISRV